jgi:YegS/Rv2252/BmrU family lipid kinase
LIVKQFFEIRVKYLNRRTFLRLSPSKVSMHRVALIYNPASGQRWWRRKGDIEQIVKVLNEAGMETETLKTVGPKSAANLAAEAAARGFDTVLACGGDGTVHEALQGLVGTDVALGVVPLGTANALAANLGLSSSPLKAARGLLTARPVRISVGRIRYRKPSGEERSRYFTVAAGVGPDALFLSRLDAGLKRRFGYLLYLVEAARIWATHSFPFFEAVFEVPGSESPRVVEISQLLAVRIRDFGGVLHKLAPGASLCNNGLRLVAFKTRSRFAYSRFLLAVMFGRQTFNRRIELLDAVSVECRLCCGNTGAIYAEADGELLGALPVRIEIVPEAINLLIPLDAKP